jgi:hypothetical protein
MLAVRRHDRKSLLTVHTHQEGHEFNWNRARIIATATSRHAREFLEAWHSTAQSINQHVQLDNSYAMIRTRLHRRRVRVPRLITGRGVGGTTRTPQHNDRHRSPIGDQNGEPDIQVNPDTPQQPARQGQHQHPAGTLTNFRPASAEGREPVNPVNQDTLQQPGMDE